MLKLYYKSNLCVCVCVCVVMCVCVCVFLCVCVKSFDNLRQQIRLVLNN